MTYKERKEAARDEAVRWSYDATEIPMSYDELLQAQAHFERLGRRYGLLAEFRENGIC